MSNHADPCVFVIFGASGDLTRSKLLPAIFNLSEEGLLPEQFAILGVARPPIDQAAYRKNMRELVRQAEGEPLRSFNPLLDIQQMNHRYVYSRLFRS